MTDHPQHKSTREADLVDALRELEDANEAVCSLRTQDIYLAMIAVPGAQDALLRLDDARRRARELIA